MRRRSWNLKLNIGHDFVISLQNEMIRSSLPRFASEYQQSSIAKQAEMLRVFSGVGTPQPVPEGAEAKYSELLSEHWRVRYLVHHDHDFDRAFQHQVNVAQY